MHYLLLGLGLAVGIYALYRFFLSASTRQIKGLFLTSAFIVIVGALFFMAVTGRLAAAIGLAVALLPVIREYWRLKVKKESRGEHETSGNPPQNSKMTRQEALELLDLDDSASREDILQAYKALVKKVHPDTKGSQGLTRKLNEARDVLLKEK